MQVTRLHQMGCLAERGALSFWPEARMSGLLLFVCLLLGSCSLNGQAPQAGSTGNRANTVLPDWVLHPDRSGYLAVVGSAPAQTMGGQMAQRRAARIDAERRLAEQIRIYVNRKQSVSRMQQGQEVASSFESATTLESSAALRPSNARILKEWVHPESGELFVLLGLLVSGDVPNQQ